MRRRGRRARGAPVLGVGALAVGAVVAPGLARAGGMEYPDLGTVAIGRGTAFVARADNPSAFYYNPAGLSKQRGGHVLIGANLVNLNVEYLRQGTGETVEIGGYTVQNPEFDFSAGGGQSEPFTAVSQSRLGPAPMIVASYADIGRAKGLAVAIGVVPPSSFGGHEYPGDGAQRYNVVKTNNLILYPGIGLSYSISRYFAIGATFLAGIGKVDVVKASRPLPQPGNTIDYNENRAWDAEFGIEATDFFMPTGTVGVLSNPVDWLEIGASVRLPVHMEAKGTLSYGAPEAYPDYALVDDPNEFVLTQAMPTIARGGVRYIHRRFDVELDVVFENWKTLQAVELDVDAALDKGDGSALTALPDVRIPRHYQNTYSIRLGGDVDVLPDVFAMRAGGFYQTSAYPDSYDTFGLDFPYGEQVGLGMGLSWRAVPALGINVGYSHIYQRDVRVTEGILQQSGLPWESPEGDLIDRGNTVNNGLYQVSLNLFGLSLEGSF